MTAEHVRISPAAARRFCVEVFEASGVGPESAAVMADCLLTASLRGVDTHGLVRLDPYAKKFRRGGFDTEPSFKFADPRRGVSTVDADGGAGPVAGTAGMERAITNAAQTGIGATVVTDSNHFGMAGYYTLQAAEHDCIGIAMTHGGPRVAPVGGVDPFFGTNPIAYSVPSDRDFHITHDMSTSAGANAKIRQARRLGEEIPSAWAIDRDGRPTTDPEAAHALRPVGAHKGYGLGLFVEACAALLGGGRFAPAVPTPYQDFSSSMDIGHCFIAIDIGAFRSIEDFYADVGTLIDRLHAVTPAADGDGVRLPGERATATSRDRADRGIPLDEATLESLRDAAARCSVAVPDIVSSA